MVQNKTAAQTYLIHMSDYDVTIVRKNVRNINLRVRRDGSVVMSIPRRAPLEDAERLVHERQGWIESHRASIRSTQDESRTCSNGETMTVWGTPLTLAVVGDANADTERAERSDSILALHVCESWRGNDEGSVRHRKAIIDAYLAGELRDALQTLLPTCEGRVGKQASAIRLRRMVSRWGSCNVETARITLNLELAERDPICLEAVLCHELCHLHERGHNRRFYEHLSRSCPQWREARAQLRKSPPHR